MHTVEQRLTGWLDLVAELLRQPLPFFPHATLTLELAATYQAMTAWGWRETDGNFGFEAVGAPPDWPTPGELTKLRHALPLHPLVRWFATTGDLRPMTMGRVPRRLASRRGRELVREMLRPVGLDQQLSIPYPVTGNTHRAFVLAQTGDDFHPDDLALAGRLQPLVALVARQSAVLESARVPHPTMVSSSLTGRELAVLHLLAEGRTAAAIGRALGISPRTAHKHLENLYRKLGVADRMRAVLVAQEQGLVRRRGAVENGEGGRVSGNALRSLRMLTVDTRASADRQPLGLAGEVTAGDA